MKRGFSHLLFTPTFRRLPQKPFEMELLHVEMDCGGRMADGKK